MKDDSAILNLLNALFSSYTCKAKAAAIKMFNDIEPTRKIVLECHLPSFSGSSDHLDSALKTSSSQFGMSVHGEDPALKYAPPAQPSFYDLLGALRIS